LNRELGWNFIEKGDKMTGTGGCGDLKSCGGGKYCLNKEL